MRTRALLLLWAVSIGASAGIAAGATKRLLTKQAAIARDRIGQPSEQALVADKTWKTKYGDAIDLLVLGDSIAAGLGAEEPKHTLGGGLARRVAKKTGRAVRLRTAAVVGAETRTLADQIDTLEPDYTPDVAIIVIGGNDVTHLLPVDESVAHLVAAVERLRAQGSAVVVGTCPDLGALRPVPQPLRLLGGRASRRLAARQRVAALRAGAHVVSLRHVVGPLFRALPQEMFGPDQFHPSTTGYKRTAKALLPSVLAALGYDTELPVGHLAPWLP